MKPIRQGDVILTPAKQIQRQKQHHLTLAEGEITGHSHRIVEGQAELYEKDDTLYLRVLSPTALLSHEEHHAIAIPEGNWMVQIQREYEPQGWRYVADYSLRSHNCCSQTHFSQKPRHLFPQFLRAQTSCFHCFDQRRTKAVTL